MHNASNRLNINAELDLTFIYSFKKVQLFFKKFTAQLMFEITQFLVLAKYEVFRERTDSTDSSIKKLNQIPKFYVYIPHVLYLFFTTSF